MQSMYNVLAGLEFPSLDPARVMKITAGALTVTQALHSGKILNLNNAAAGTGMPVTLPNATGTGAVYTFFVGATITVGTITITRGTSADVMNGLAAVSTSAPLTTIFRSASNSNKLTLNGSTTGGTLGDFIQLIDISTNQFWVMCELAGSGTIATPFSNV